jgi:hypothetical protein
MAFITLLDVTTQVNHRDTEHTESRSHDSPSDAVLENGNVEVYEETKFPVPQLQIGQ